MIAMGEKLFRFVNSNLLDGFNRPVSTDSRLDDLQRMIAVNHEIVSHSDDFFGYVTPTDFRLEGMNLPRTDWVRPAAD